MRKICIDTLREEQHINTVGEKKPKTQDLRRQTKSVCIRNRTWNLWEKYSNFYGTLFFPSSFNQVKIHDTHKWMMPQWFTPHAHKLVLDAILNEKEVTNDNRMVKRKNRILETEIPEVYWKLILTYTFSNLH